MYFINYSLIQRDSCILQIMQGRCASSVLWRENIGQTCIMSMIECSNSLYLIESRTVYEQKWPAVEKYKFKLRMDSAAENYL